MQRALGVCNFESSTYGPEDVFQVVFATIIVRIELHALNFAIISWKR